MKRRNFFAAIGTAGAVGLAGCQTDEDNANGDDEPSHSEPAKTASEDGSPGDAEFGDDGDYWPLPFNDPANTGRNAGASGPREGLSRRWEFDATEVEHGWRLLGLTAPIVADGTVVVGELWQPESGDEEETLDLVGLDASDGSVVWEATHPIDGLAITSPLAVAYNDGVLSTSAVDNGALAWQPPETPDTTDLRWFDPGDGEETASETTDALMGAAVVEGGRLYAYGAGAVIAQAASDGSLEWEYEYVPEATDNAVPFEVLLDHPPTVADETVVACANHLLLAVDVGGDEPRWTLAVTEFDAYLGESADHSLYQPAVADGVAYGVLDGRWTIESDDDIDDYEGEQFGAAFGVNVEDGEVRWSWQPPVERHSCGVAAGKPAVDDERVYVTGWDQSFGDSPTRNVDVEYRLYAVDAQTGETVWEAPIDGMDPVPVAASETVYAVTDESVAAFDASTGDVLAREEFDEFRPDDEVPPAVVDDLLVIAGEERVVAFEG